MKSIKKTEQLIIAYSSLKTGVHDYIFDIDKKFFGQIDNSLIKDGNAKIDVKLHKMSTMMQFDLSFSGNINISCGRCLDEVFIPLKGEDKLIVKFGNEEIGDDANIITLNTSEHEVNITQFVYEMIALQLPLRSVPCEILEDPTVCDKQMLNKLKEIEIHENGLNEEKSNPLWDKLKTIKNLN